MSASTERMRYAATTHLTQTPGIVFSVGRNATQTFGPGAPFLARDIAVAPGDPDRLAVSRQMPVISPGGEGTVIFDNGVPLPSIGPGNSETPFYLAFSSSASILYGGTFDSGLRTMTVGANGVTDSTGTRTTFSTGKIDYENGLIFDGKAHVIDAETRTLRGTCSGIVHRPNYLNVTSFVPDTATGRVLYAVKHGSEIEIKACDLATFLEIGSMSIPVGSDTFPAHLVRYGTNGLAMRTTDDGLFLIQTSLIPTTNPLPVPTASPASGSGRALPSTRQTIASFSFRTVGAENISDRVSGPIGWIILRRSEPFGCREYL